MKAERTCIKVGIVDPHLEAEPSFETLNDFAYYWGHQCNFAVYTGQNLWERKEGWEWGMVLRRGGKLTSAPLLNSEQLHFPYRPCTRQPAKHKRVTTPDVITPVRKISQNTAVLNAEGRRGKELEVLTQAKSWYLHMTKSVTKCIIIQKNSLNLHAFEDCVSAHYKYSSKYQQENKHWSYMIMAQMLTKKSIWQKLS